VLHAKNRCFDDSLRRFREQNNRIGASTSRGVVFADFGVVYVATAGFPYSRLPIFGALKSPVCRQT
jgi:hypothetical protein